MIAVTFALPQESHTFVRSLARVQMIRSGHLPWLSGLIGNVEIVVCHTGIGAESTGTVVGELVAKMQPHRVISSGFAGALDQRLKIGDLIIGANFSEADWCAQAAEVIHLMRPAPRCFVGTLTTQDSVVEHSSAKAALAEKSGALAVDMETATIRAVCTDQRLPMLSLRAISDLADQTLPVPFSVWFDARSQRPRRWAVLGFLTAHPGAVPAFARFVRGVHHAQHSLSGALDQCIRHWHEERR